MTGIGIVGAGYFGEVHARSIARLDAARLVAVAGGRRADAEALASRFGGRAEDDWRTLIENPDVDIVALATPHHLHAEMAIAALERGKHVMLEKPMAPTPEACDAILAAEAAGAGRLMVGHLAHFLRPVITARRIVESGRLGRPVTGTTTLVKLWMQANRKPWHLERGTGGGMLMTAGIHAVDQLVWLMGGRVSGVAAMAGALFHDQQADDSALIGLRFEDGRIGQVASIGYRDGASTSALSLQCEGGVIDVDLGSGVRIGRGGAWTTVEDSWEADGMAQGVLREWTGFLEAIESGAPAPVTGAYARHIVAILDAALRASEERREVAVG